MTTKYKGAYIDAPLLLGLVLAVAAAGCSEDPSGGNGGDADTDTDTDSYFYGDPCAGEVEVDGVFWCRCDVGQSWNGEICEGDSEKFGWESASEICPEGYGLPSHVDFAALLGNCSGDFDEDDMVTCDSCSQSESCVAVFEDDPFRSYWTANGPGEMDMALAVQLSDGDFYWMEMDYSERVRCRRWE